MKVQNITDVEGFFKVVDSCKGRVELVTGEGDRLNLKSKLSQYVSMANIFSNGEIPELEVIAYEKEDTDKLIQFMMDGGNKKETTFKNFHKECNIKGRDSDLCIKSEPSLFLVKI